jgi:hypothetical protein
LFRCEYVNRKKPKEIEMKTKWFLMTAIAICMVCGCSSKSTVTVAAQEEAEGEEGGPGLSINQVHDTVRNGVRMILRYNEASKSFDGTVENITEKPIQAVRVEVHLIDGPELGPTPRKDLAPGQKREITLSTGGQPFKLWKAHAESGEGEESGHGSEGEGEHGSREGREEHSRREGNGEHS